MVDFNDKLVNLISNLGTGRDKASGARYVRPVISDEQLVNAYRGSWLPGKIVDIPPQDATRKWREWQATAEQITAIEQEEQRLGLREKIKQALIGSRLFGGAGVFIGTDEQDVSQPFNPQSVGRGGIRYITVLTRRQLTAGDLDMDPLSPRYNQPLWYSVSGSSTVNIHPSRMILFTGRAIPDPDLSCNSGWGDSILTSIIDIIQQADGTTANVASLVYEALVDVIRIPNFNAGMADDEYQRQVTKRFQLAATLKGINGTLLLDKEEEFERKTHEFNSLRDLMMAFIQLVSGAADIPTTRLLGQTPSGLQSTGESDLKNYYDSVQSIQELVITPAMREFDEALVRSALGSRPPEIYYNWSSLWQTDETERADIGKKTAETIKILSETHLFDTDALSEASFNMLIERGVMPGLEQMEEK